MAKKNEVNETNVNETNVNENELPVLNAIATSDSPVVDLPALGDMLWSQHIKLYAVGRAVSQETKNAQWENRQDKTETRESLYKRENLPAPTQRGVAYYIRFADQTVTFKIHTDDKTKRVYFSQFAIWDENPAKYDSRVDRNRGRRFKISDNAKFIRYNALDLRINDAGDIWQDDSWQTASNYWQNVVYNVLANKARAKLITSDMDYTRD